jgi:O-antigen/teichoic acid export membrane protein
MTVSFALGKVAQLISQVILARLLSPKDFGIWAMVLILTNFSVLFRDVAIAQVLVHRGLNNKSLVNTVYSLGVNISIGLFVLQALAGWPLSQFFRVPVLFLLVACSAIVFLIGAGAGSHTAVMQRQMKFKELAICDGFANFARVGSATFCAFFGWGVWSFAVGEVAMALVDSLLKRSFSGYRFAYSFKLDPVAVHEVRKFIAGILGGNVAVQINTNADNLTIGRLVGTQALGYYNLAYQLAMMPVYALSQVNRVIFSVLSQQDNEGKKVYLCRALELYAVLSAPIYGVVLVIAPWIIPLLYGRAWVEAVSLFQIILIFAYARGFMAILGTTLTALNKPVTNAVINWVLVPISIASYFLGATLGGTQGVAIAVALVMGVGASVWFWLATCRAAGWKLELLIKPILLPTVTMSIALMLMFTIPFPEHLRAYMQPVVLVLLYAVALSIFSKGRIPYMLMGMVKLSLNKGGNK